MTMKHDAWLQDIRDNDPDRFLPQPSVADYSDADLVERAVKNARLGRRRQPRWQAVMRAFGLGSTYSHQLCARFGLDPNEMVSG